VNLFRLGLTLSLLLLVTACVTAGDGKKSKNAEGTVGTVTKINTVAKTFTFRVGKKKDSKEIMIQFDKHTQFLKAGGSETEDSDVNEMAIRMRVAVVYETRDDGKNMATKVTILPGKK
jgi:hypothetical protein